MSEFCICDVFKKVKDMNTTQEYSSTCVQWEDWSLTKHLISVAYLAQFHRVFHIFRHFRTDYKWKTCWELLSLFLSVLATSLSMLNGTGNIADTLSQPILQDGAQILTSQQWKDLLQKQRGNNDHDSLYNLNFYVFFYFLHFLPLKSWRSSNPFLSIFFTS